jgi:hypothetical protein
LLGGNQGDAVSIQKFKRSDIIAVRKPKAVIDSKTVGAATVGGIAVVAQQVLSEAEAVLGEVAAQYDWANYALSVVTVASLGFVIYDRIRRLRLNGQ